MTSNSAGDTGTSEGSADHIVLTLPASPRLRGVATLVLGGIGTRLDLPYERVDDLQLAVLSVLAASDVETVTIAVDVAEDDLLVSVGPLPGEVARDPGLERVLKRLVDGVEPGRPAPASEAGSTSAGDWLGLRLGRTRSAASV